ncbi:hypothetical protein EJ05DRAFT_514280 [Pseudovirgaria hyperparasitica]|uniref:Actin cytoskeleton-regulatory complex protein SLA1 n=1 Tax=Pseudovirgaria hyperparasitica TaxID=470096 RepID=A0A6A6VZP2_9PEZI|nr:uncharacterized protein EJ05DRAFT_514280 [Pseudovirgaria hyperparasitica]KAF2754281.1 hypothetical protein EJ05DRAFT_514280 [Pseudovirgaria hyperparasitica]
MVFLGIYRAIYDYAPQAETELQIAEGDLLFVLEKSTDDDWWKAKRKASSEEEEEAEGLIPNNYIEEAVPIAKAKAMYDYTRQTDEELSFSEEDLLDVYDTSDPDWTLVGFNGEYGFAPANYIEMSDSPPETPAALAAPAAPAAPAMPPRPTVVEPEDEEDEPNSPPPISGPAAALAQALRGQGAASAGPSAPRSAMSPPPNLSAPPKKKSVQFTPEESDEEIPPPNLPQRPPSQTLSPPITQYASPRTPMSPPTDYDDEDRHYQRSPLSPSGYHLYNIHEMVSHMGKNKKMPMTLGINVPKGTIMISPEKAKNGPEKEWTAEKLTHYSIEGKHVFMELVRPSKSVDFHAGAKDTAQEIVAYLGELAGAARGGGMEDVLAAGSGGQVQKKGKMVYEFMAQGDDEVTVALDDEVIIIDDTKSDEWWQVRRLKNGKEGVVPSSYVEITGTINVSAAPSRSRSDAGLSIVEQNRLEEERLARQATKSQRKNDSRGAEVGPGLRLPERQSSLAQGDPDTKRHSQRKRDSTAKSSSSSKSKPDSSKVRTWTDRTGSFKVDAEFIGLRDNKIHLHKLNGVKIAVPVQKMAIEDLEYVERRTGVSLDEDKPLSEIKRRSTLLKRDNERASKAGITVEKKSDYDWFDFFLSCGVNPQICQTYTSAFEKDQMGEENMADINEKLLRTLGVKEGDILRVMKYLDAKYGRVGGAGDSADAKGGLFSGPGGALRNNTGKGRPAPPVQTNDVVDAKVFEQMTDAAVKQPPPDAQATSLASAPVKQPTNGFDDNAWEVKPSKQPTPAASSPAQQTTSPPPAAQRPPTGAMAELSLLDQPLIPAPPEPKAAPQPPVQQHLPAPQPQPAVLQQPAQTGATQSVFDQVAAATMKGQQQPMAPPRQRPMAPQQTGMPGSLIQPPPQRAASAPQNFQQQQSAFGPPPPLQPQLTGYQPQVQAQVSPAGQSLQELQQQRMQQQNFLQMQPTGFQQQNQFGQFSQPSFQIPQPTGFNQFQQQPQFQPSNGSPFADPPRAPFQPQPTGFQQSFSPMQPQQTGINAFLQPALQPQRTGFQQPSQQTGFGGTSGFTVPPVPPIPTQPTIAPLQPQKTGPAPQIKFGVQPGQKKLVPQPTGRANLSKATPQNPFGF